MATVSILSAESFIASSLERQLDRLVLESDSLANVIQTFRGIVPNLLDTLKQKFSTVNENEELSQHMAALIDGHKVLSKKTEHVPFLSFNQTLISVPENFSGNFVEYAIFLNTAAPGVYDEAMATLDQYKSLLSVFLSTKEATISYKDHTAFYSNVQRSREAQVEQFKKFFPKDTGLSKQRLYTAVDRFSDFDKLIHELTTLEKMHEKQNLRAFRKAVQECVDLLALVIRRTEKESCDNISQVTAKNIAQGAYELGKFVEYVALFRFRVEQFMTSVQNTVTDINTILK